MQITASGSSRRKAKQLQPGLPPQQHSAAGGGVTKAPEPLAAAAPAIAAGWSPAAGGKAPLVSRLPARFAAAPFSFPPRPAGRSEGEAVVGLRRAGEGGPGGCGRPLRRARGPVGRGRWLPAALHLCPRCRPWGLPGAAPRLQPAPRRWLRPGRGPLWPGSPAGGPPAGREGSRCRFCDRGGWWVREGAEAPGAASALSSVYFEHVSRIPAQYRFIPSRLRMHPYFISYFFSVWVMVPGSLAVPLYVRAPPHLHRPARHRGLPGCAP